MKNRIVCWVMCLVMLVGCLCGCSEAEKVNKNISKQANYFETERHITVYNARTDKVILEAEGLMSITNNEELYLEVLKAMKEYSGEDDGEGEEYEC